MNKRATCVICNIFAILLLVFIGSQVMAQAIVVEAYWPAQGDRSDNKQVGFSYNGPGRLLVTRYFEPVLKYGNDIGGMGGIFPDCRGCRMGEYMKMGEQRCYQNGKQVNELVAGIPARCEWEFFLTESKRYWGTFEISSIFWTNPAMSHQEGPQHVKAVLSYKPDISTGIPVAPTGSGNWQSVGTGDCPGRDVANTAGPNPDPAKCTDAVRGQTAVCWDQGCTYKNIATGSCTGGASPGRMYTCGGQAAQPVTIYWHIADDADVYLNGVPLRRYEPSFRTRGDEAPLPAFSAQAVLKNGDVFTVGGRRGGSYGFMLIAVDAAGKVVFQTDRESWKVYEPGDRADWFAPSVIGSSQNSPVTVQPNPWNPQKELNAKHGDTALSIWSNPSNRYAYLCGIVGGVQGAGLPPTATVTGGNLALNRPASQSSTSQWSTANDAQGAVDGVKNGEFGFHTDEEANPWWQVDLGAVQQLSEVRIFNRSTYSDRAKSIQVLLSNDGTNWTRVYAHNGSVFGENGRPLAVAVNGRAARYVRLRLAEINWLHLDEVEVYGQAASATGPPPPATPPTSANRRTVSPSTRPQTVTVNGVSVTIPGGLLTNAATLTVAPSSAAAQLPKPIAEAVVLGAYDISLGEAVTFAQALTLAIPYDPAMLDPSMPEGKNLWVSSWDAQAGAWVDHAVEVDTANKRLIVRTDHLSTWLYWKAQGFRRVPSVWWGPCEVYYHPNHAQPRTDVADGYTMEDLANDVVTAVTSARQAYKAAGFTPPNSQVKVIIYDAPSSRLFGLTGNVHLNRSELTTLALLRQESGHELFHVFQNQYYNVYGMGYRHWWIESTPDYAAAVIAWNNLAELPDMDATYFEESLFVDDDPHSYQNSQYILYLVNLRNLSFKAMWDAVKANSGLSDNGVAAFQNYVAGATGKVFDEEWANFVDYALFTPSGPMRSVATKGFNVVDVARTNTEVSRTGSRTVSVPNYAAKIVVVGVVPSPGKTTRPIKVSATGLDRGARVEIWQLQNNDRATARLKSILVDDNSIAYFDLAARDRVWVVVLNTSAAEQSVTVTAADTVSAEPSWWEGVYSVNNQTTILSVENGRVKGVPEGYDPARGVREYYGTTGGYPLLFEGRLSADGQTLTGTFIFKWDPPLDQEIGTFVFTRNESGFVGTFHFEKSDGFLGREGDRVYHGYRGQRAMY